MHQQKTENRMGGYWKGTRKEWMVERKEGMIQGKLTARGRRAAFSRLAGVAMVTELGRDVIMPRLIQTWQAPITPPLETKRAGLTGQCKERKGCLEKEGGQRRMGKCPRIKDLNPHTSALLHRQGHWTFEGL